MFITNGSVNQTDDNHNDDDDNYDDHHNTSITGRHSSGRWRLRSTKSHRRWSGRKRYARINARATAYLKTVVLCGWKATARRGTAKSQNQPAFGQTNARGGSMERSDYQSADVRSSRLRRIPGNGKAEDDPAVQRTGSLGSFKWRYIMHSLYQSHIFKTHNCFPGRDAFIANKCPVNTCKITADRSQAETADLILYKDHYIPPRIQRTAKQLFMLYFLECPYHTPNVKFPNVFNWTSTYRYVQLYFYFFI